MAILEVTNWQWNCVLLRIAKKMDDSLVQQRNSKILVDLDLRCIENVLTDNDSQHLQEQEST